MAANGISTLTGANPIATKILRRTQKLALAAAKRSQINMNGYRDLNDLGADTHVAYVLNTLQTLSGAASPNTGRPWQIRSDFVELEQEISGNSSGIVIGTEDGNILG